MRWLAVLILLLAWAHGSLSATGTPSEAQYWPDSYPGEFAEPSGPLQPPVPGSGNSERECQTKATDNPYPTQADHCGTKDAPLVVQLTQPLNIAYESTPDAETAGKNAPPEWWPLPGMWPHPDWALNTLTLCLVLIGVVQIGVFGLQANRLKRTINTMETTERRQLRAYVNVAGITAHKVTDITKSIQYHIVIENTGRTPAYKVRTVYTAEILEYPLSLYPETEISGYLSETIIGGGKDAETVFDAPRPLRQDEISELANGTKAIYVFGRIDYQDIFGRDHWTKFRSMVGGPTLPRDDGVMAACSEGNECSNA